MDLVEVEKRDKTAGSPARHPWELARLEVVNKLLQGHISNTENYTVLDIGCGDIFFIMGLSEIYPKTRFVAVDIAFTDAMIEKYKNQAAGKNILLFKSLEEAKAQLKDPVNMVLLLDVVEHIDDHIGFLKMLNAHPAIDQNTRIMITVPAYQSLFCSHDHFLGHFRRYNNSTLLETIQTTGFEKLKVGYFFSVLLPPRILQVFKEKIVKPNLNEHTTGLVEWNKGKGFTALVKNILLLDFGITNFIQKIIGLRLPGLSNYILCKKRA
jgi:trans-aconitate methyltransferase